MALTCQVARIFAKNPGEIQPEDMKLKFSFKKKGKKAQKDKENLRKMETIVAKHRWGLLVGKPPPPEVMGIPQEWYEQPKEE